MLRRRIIFIALLGLAASAAPVLLSAADAPAPPTLIIRLQSIDHLIADVKYLAGVAGRADEAKRLDARHAHLDRAFLRVRRLEWR